MHDLLGSTHHAKINTSEAQVMSMFTSKGSDHKQTAFCIEMLAPPHSFSHSRRRCQSRANSVNGSELSQKQGPACDALLAVTGQIDATQSNAA